MHTPSFEKFDYVLRTNKSIERRIVFDLIISAKRRFSLSNYWYLGFGSMWFGDFKIAHRALHVDDMISIERKEHAPRAEYNKPFSSIQVIGGDCTNILKNEIDSALWRRPAVSWLDYDGRVDESVIADISELSGKLQADSFLLITVNGARSTYRPKEAALNAGGPKSALKVVSNLLNSASIPSAYIADLMAGGRNNEVPEADFPQFLGQALLNHMQHAVSSAARVVSGTGETPADDPLGFFPTFLLHHKDGADMVTVGGAIILESQRKEWETLFAEHSSICESGKTKYCAMDLIPLTIKEKIVLDQSLPNAANSVEYIQKVRSSGIKLSDSDIEKYRGFYRQFPVFAETTY